VGYFLRFDMWDVNKIYKLLLFLTKSNQSGRISSGDFFNAWNTEQNAYHTDLVGKWENRNNGKAGANTGLILNQTTVTLLAPFTILGSIPLVSGIASKPADFIYEVGKRLLISGKEHKVDTINHSQIIYVNEDVIDPPSIADNKYYAVEYGNDYSLLPITATGVLKLDYIASCEDVVWGFTLDVDGRQVYDAGTSIQPKWNQPTILSITKRALTSFGVSFKDNDFTRFGEKNTATGDS
jgi:hypothetical protein